MGIAFQVEVRHHGTYRGRVSPHRVPAIIGSARTADIQLRDSTVAPNHAEVVEGPDGMVLVRDLGGPGGVRVNGMRLRNAEIRPGDVVEIGEYALVVVEAHQTREIVDRESWVDLPSSQRDEGEPCVEMYVLWNDKVLDVHHFRHMTKKERRQSRIRGGGIIPKLLASGHRASVDVREPEYVLSDRPGGDLLLPDGVLKKGQRFELIKGNRKRDLLVNISHSAIDGEVRLRSGQIIDLKTAKSQTGGVIKIEQGVRVRADMGPYTFLIQGTNSGPKPKKFGMSRDAAAVLFLLLLSFLGHMGFMYSFLLWPEDGLSLSLTDYETRHGVVEVLKIAYEPDEPEEVEPEVVNARRVDDDGNGEDENESDNKNPNRLVDKLTPEEQRKRSEELAYSSGLSKAMRDQSELIDEALSGIDASGYDSALRALAVSSDDSDDRASTNLGVFSGAVGEQGGNSGLGGLPGAGSAGGSGGSGLVAGLGKSDVTGDHVNVRFRNNRRQKALVKTGRLTVRGGYDAGIIRRYIKSKLNELRWCHRQAIQRDPNVAGKITVKFMIQPNGLVPQATVVKASTTTNAPDLEFCITSKIKTWRFPPPPQAGASAVVTYPFIFTVVR